MSLVLDGTNGITFPSTTVQSDAGVGYGQTWQDVTATRAAGTTYTNSTGKPIMVLIRANSSTGYLLTNGVQFPYSGTASTQTSVIIPNGGTYSYPTSTFNLWAELR